MTLKTMKRELHQMDENLEEGTPEFDTALILLASLMHGPRVRAIARFTELPLKYVSEVGSRLRANKIWTRRRVYGNWFNEEDGAIGFWLDVCVGNGLMQRT